MPLAFDEQVGGNHYKTFAIQPSEYCELNKLSHLQSQVIKYVSRAGKKGDEIEDWEKARHCIDLKLQLLKKEKECTQ